MVVSIDNEDRHECKGANNHTNHEIVYNIEVSIDSIPKNNVRIINL
jgi:hypothetical protein